MAYIDCNWSGSVGRGQTALIWRNREYTFSDSRRATRNGFAAFRSRIQPGASVALIGDYSPGSVSCLLALLKLRCILVPLSRESRDQHEAFFTIAELDYVIEMDADDRGEPRPLANRQNHPLLERLRAASDPGLVLFSSGSTGTQGDPPFLTMCAKSFAKPRRCYRRYFSAFRPIGGSTRCSIPWRT